MRVAFVFPVVARQGGVERAVWEFARNLSGQHDLTIVSQKLEDLGRVATHRRVAARPRWVPRSFAPAWFRFAAARALRGARFDAVVSFGANCPPGDVVVVNSVHRAWLQLGKDIRLGRFKAPNWARRLLPRHLVLLALERCYFRSKRSITVGVSARVLDDIERLYGLEGPVAVVPNGFDPAVFSFERRSAQRGEARCELGIEANQIVLLMVANELQRKGFGVLVEAIAGLDDRFHVHLVGRKAPTAFEDQMRNLGVVGRVHFHGQTTRVDFFHAAADAFVLPTQYEAFALAIVEALASGVPVVTTSVPGAGDLIVHGTNGLLLNDPLDSRALCRLISSLEDEALRRQLSTGAATSVTHYSWLELSGLLETILLTVAKGRIVERLQDPTPEPRSLEHD